MMMMTMMIMAALTENCVEVMMIIGSDRGQGHGQGHLAADALYGLLHLCFHVVFQVLEMLRMLVLLAEIIHKCPQ